MSWAAIGPVGLQVLLNDPTTSAYIAKSACQLTSVLWPVYDTYKAIEDTSPGRDAHRVQWLTYWCIYGSLNLVESSLERLPFYHHAKFIFLLWLISPHTKGAFRLYHACLKPTLTKYRPKLDTIVDMVSMTVGRFTDSFLLAFDNFIKWFFDSKDGSSTE